MAMIASTRDWLRARPLVGDALLALAVFAIFVGLYVPYRADIEGPAWRVLSMAALGAAPVVIRRRWPGIAAAATAGVIVANGLLDQAVLTEGLTVLVLIYTFAAYLSVRRAILWTAVIAAGTAFYLLIGPGNAGYGDWFSNALIMVVSFFIGRTVFSRRAYTQALEERARVAEASRETSAREAVLEERRRIARELHDVVAHHVSVMGVLATGARRNLHRDPAVADEALATIESTGRTTLREMRRLLDVLGHNEEADTALRPQPGLSGLDGFLAQVREAGLPVHFAVTGTPRALDPGVDLTLFRIVQEALTNALKHAGPASSEVRLEFRPDSLMLEVSDTGRGPAASTEQVGHGLVSMRERVALYGGTLRTGPRTGGGYSVLASIPLDSVSEVAS